MFIQAFLDVAGDVAGTSDTVNAVAFDGSEYLERTTAFTGIQASYKNLLCSFWIKINASAPSNFTLFDSLSSSGDRVNIAFSKYQNVWRASLVFSRPSSVQSNGITMTISGYTVLNQLAGEGAAASTWTHFLMAVSHGASPFGVIYQDDSLKKAVEAPTGVYTNINGNITSRVPMSTFSINNGGTNKYYIGRPYTTATTQIFHGDLSEFYLDVDAAGLTMTNVVNRRKFITDVPDPAALGADGSTPTGEQPLIYLGNAFGTFQTNLGYGGDFTVTGGTLTAAADSPSD